MRKKTPNRRIERKILPAVAAAALAWIGARPVDAAAARTSSRPNFVVILVDDLGWRDLSVEGSAFYETPRVDSLAREGMRFTQGYATCQVCSPSRASLMTGKFPVRVGITEWIGAAAGKRWRRNTKLLPAEYRHELPLEETTLAEALHEAGYRTFFAGKWHLGGKGFHPEDQGFETNKGGHWRGSPPGGYFSPYHNPKLEDGPIGESLPIRLAQETCRFIRTHKTEPFFAYLCFYSVHAPDQTTEALWRKYRDKAAKNPPPKRRFIIDRTLPVRQVQDHPVYAGMVETMDRAVGMVLDTLHRTGLEKDTVVLFTSDNGGVSAGDAKSTANLPLRGGKGWQWEGGIREPFYVKWPGVTRPGSTCSVPVTGADVYPTLLQIAGLRLRPKQHVDGVSLVPLLKGGRIPPRALFWHYPHYSNQGGEPSSIIQEGEWKLIHYYEDGRNELYNLAEDPGERRDLAAAEPGRAARMYAKLKAFLDEAGARYPTPNPNFNPTAYARQQERIRKVLLPALEREHAAFLRPNWKPRGGWWQFRGD